MRDVPRVLRRLYRRREQTTSRTQLNLVALMDVFTILVFFFLVHSSDVAEPSNRNLVRLPESVANRPPRETLVLTITRDTLLLEGKPVTSLEAILEAPAGEIEALRMVLGTDALAVGAGAPDTDAPVREVTIKGDRSVPFRVLKKVMFTCSQAGYERISLAVLQRTDRSG